MVEEVEKVRVAQAAAVRMAAPAAAAMAVTQAGLAAEWVAKAVGSRVEAVPAGAMKAKSKKRRPGMM